MTDVAAMLLAYPGKLEHFDRDELVLGVQECLDCAQTCTAYLCADDLATGRLVAPVSTDDPPTNTLYLATRTATRQEPHIAHARAALLEHARRW